MAGRDLSLTPRKVATRAKAKVEIFKIDDIERHFNENISYIKSQYQTADALIKDGKTGEAADIWRSQIVFLDSAFDFYLHELVQCIWHFPPAGFAEQNGRIAIANGRVA